ncbi:hypothetical protein [White spot syndrome virus]|uniref:Wsv340 n=2 Tax=White spot syndrome virus TaxID=342409 RepID=A0A2U9GC14_WSSV|nr:hypothetical protein [White spot syndrome virus]AWQ62198.1 wsv340 [Shrimp white spot syndrome virus]
MSNGATISDERLILILDKIVERRGVSNLSELLIHPITKHINELLKNTVRHGDRVYMKDAELDVRSRLEDIKKDCVLKAIEKQGIDVRQIITDYLAKRKLTQNLVHWYRPPISCTDIDEKIQQETGQVGRCSVATYNLRIGGDDGEFTRYDFSIPLGDFKITAKLFRSINDEDVDAVILVSRSDVVNDVLSFEAFNRTGERVVIFFNVIVEGKSKDIDIVCKSRYKHTHILNGESATYAVERIKRGDTRDDILFAITAFKEE